jgi:hypothetical protein
VYQIPDRGIETGHCKQGTHCKHLNIIRRNIMIEKKKVVLRKRNGEEKVTETMFTVTANYIGDSTKGTYERYDLEENKKIKGSFYVVKGQKVSEIDLNNGNTEKTKETKNYDRYSVETEGYNGNVFIDKGKDFTPVKIILKK